MDSNLVSRDNSDGSESLLCHLRLMVASTTSTNTSPRYQGDDDGTPPAQESSRRPSSVLGIGCPVGHERSLHEFLAALPVCSHAALVVVPIAPVIEVGRSEVGSFDRAALEAAAARPVLEASDGTRMVAKGVYLMRGGTRVSLEGDRLHVRESPQSGAAERPFDHFLASLAATWGSKGIGALLSHGTGDGVRGMGLLGGSGGLALVASVELEDQAVTAGEDGASVATLPAEDMAGFVCACLKRLSSDCGHADEIEPELARLREELSRELPGGVEHYERDVFLHRVERRMAAHRLCELAAYFALILREPGELAYLRRSLLTKGRRFFGQPHVFAAVGEVLGALLVEPERERLRVWVAGCDTGEDAYSLAMLIQEQLDLRNVPLAVQIFATSLDGEALDVARAGRYPASIAAHISPERLGRFFVRENEYYRVSWELRTACTFLSHNLFSDPPLSDIDLLSCRGRISDFDEVHVAQLARMFHITLQPQGYLLLGSYETAGAPPVLYESIHAEAGLYRVRPLSAGRGGDGAAEPSEGEDAVTTGRSVALPALRSMHQRAALERSGCRSVLVDEHLSVLDVCGRLGDYLELAWSGADSDILALARSEVRPALEDALRRARADNRAVTIPNLTRSGKGGDRPYDLLVEPWTRAGVATGMWWIGFREYAPTPPRSAGGAGGEAPEDPERARLAAQLQAAMVQVQRAGEALAAYDEERLQARRALSSSATKLRRLRAELQEAEERQQVLGEELQAYYEDAVAKGVELERALADRANLLRRAPVAVVFLDMQLRIRHFTAAAAELLHVRAVDEGRSIGDIKLRIPGVELLQVAREVLKSGASRSLTLARTTLEDGSERRYAFDASPYFNLDGDLDGVTLRFDDVTERDAQAMRAKHLARQQAALVRLGEVARVAESMDAIWGEALAAVRECLGTRYVAFFELRGPALVRGPSVGWDDGGDEDAEPVYVDISPGDAVLREDAACMVADLRRDTRTAVRALAPSDRATSGLSCALPTMLRADSGSRRLLCAHTVEMHHFTAEDGDFLRLVAHLLSALEARLAARQEERERADAVAALSGELQAMYGSQALALGRFDHQGRYCRVNAALASMHGVAADALVGRAAAALEDPLGRALTPHVSGVLAGGEAARGLRILAGEGEAQRVWRVDCAPVLGAGGAVVGVSVMALDVSAKQRVVAPLRENSSQLFAALERAPVPLTVVDEDGHILLMSDALFDSHGYARDDIEDVESWMLQISTLDSEHYGKMLAAQFEHDGPSLDGTFRVRTRYGDTLVWATHSAPIGTSETGRRMRLSMWREIAEEEPQPTFATGATGALSDASLKEASGSAPVLLWTFLADNMDRWFHRTWRDFSGRRFRDGESTSWTEGVHPDDVERCIESFSSAFDEARGFELEYRVRRQGGSYRWVLDRGTPRFDEGGALVGFVGSCIDITEHREAVAAVAESQRWLERIADASPDALAVYDTDDKYLLYGNIQLTQVLAYPLEDLRALPPAGLLGYVHAQDEAELKKLFVTIESARPGAMHQHSLRVRHADGGYRWLDIRVVPFAWSDLGRVYQWLVVAHDITEFKRTQQALRESDMRFRQAVIDAPLPIMLYTDDDEILATSGAWLEATGYSGDEMGSVSDWLRLAFGDAADAVRARIARAFEAGQQMVSREMTVRMRDGSMRQWLFNVSAPQKLPDGRSYFIEVAVDVTELRAAQRALEDSARQKDDFLAMLGHKLRNPLAAVRHATEFLQLKSPDPQRMARLTAVLDRQGAQMARLIDGLLDVTSMVRGTLRLRREPLDLVEVLGSVVEAHRPSIDAKKLKLRVESAHGPLWMLGDRIRLVQVFDNLLSNAIKFTPPPGDIAVMLAHIDAEHVELSVSDTGVGIAPAVQACIFEPFQQATVTVERAGGLGLGLSLAKGLVELHGGEIGVSSRGPNPGTVFTVRLPLSPDDLTPKPAPAPIRHATGGAPLSILVIEDNEDAGELLSSLLTMSGHTVRVALTGVEGLTMARAEVPDVILCDIGLPGMTGYQVARAVRGDERLAQVWLIALTGYGHDGDRRKSRLAGFDMHLIKPVDLPDIEAALERYLRARRSGGEHES